METLIIKSKGKEFECLYDKRDRNLICRHTWSLNGGGYATTTINGKTFLMHRLILGVTDPKIQVDHKFHNRLDNRRAKIRICSHSENQRNSRKLTEGTSKLKGIYKDGKYYHAQIFINERVQNLGRYRSEQTAGKVYDNSAREVFKAFAFLNFPGFIEVKQLSIPGF